MNYIEPETEQSSSDTYIWGNLIAPGSGVDESYPKPESEEEKRERLWKLVQEFSSSS